MSDVVYSPLFKVERHAEICSELNKLYAAKNADYGDSFSQTYAEEGMAMPRIRLSDKLNRFKRLTHNNNQQVKAESVRDTLIDLANYAIMTIIELDNEENKKDEFVLNNPQMVTSYVPNTTSD